VQSVGFEDGVDNPKVHIYLTRGSPLVITLSTLRESFGSEIFGRAAPQTCSFALGGDPGSLVVNDDASAAVGILFAANPSGEYGWIVPMPAVRAAFGGLDLVAAHGAE